MRGGIRLFTYMGASMNTWRDVRRTVELGQVTDAFALHIWNEVCAMHTRPDTMTRAEFDHAVRVVFNNIEGEQ